MDTLIDRPSYLSWLRRWRDHDLIKVVTGVRRCGKSTLFQIFQNELRASGVPDDHIVNINLEDPTTAAITTDYLTFYQHVIDQLPPQGMTYVFVDEVQRLPEFEKAADGLHLRPQVDLYLTGSNANLLSSDLATLLSGRYVELDLLPLSFAEFVSAHPTNLAKADLFQRYLDSGGFPYVTRLGDDTTAISEYLTGLINTILIKDVAIRQKISNASRLSRIVDYMADNIGNLTTLKKISDTLTSLGQKVSQPTVENYLRGLEDAYLLYPGPRFDIRGKRRLEVNQKYYLVDTGLRRALLGRSSPDTGRVLENVVFLQLLRQAKSLYVGKLGSAEVDFVVEYADRTEYVQVCQTVTAPETLARELAPLQAIPDYYPRTLLTLDPGTFTHAGINQFNIVDWLLNLG
ncbi:MAG: ATP-binding protein [Propionibacteriaceae bacterium]|jgi:predicted AAA+ superfamily ATPase|nr:ATP-binding protein [Propionibacteriaceae bacterium]